MARSFPERLCNVLIKNKIITQQEASDLKRDFEGRSKETFDNFLLTEGFIEKRDLLNALSVVYEVPAFDVIGHFFNHDLLNEFPKDVLLSHVALPLTRDENIVVFIVSEPENEELLVELSEYCSDEIEFYVGIQGDIIDAIEEYYDESPFSIDQNSMDENSDEEPYTDERMLEDIFDRDDD